MTALYRGYDDTLRVIDCRSNEIVARTALPTIRRKFARLEPRAQQALLRRQRRPAGRGRRDQPGGHRGSFWRRREPGVESAEQSHLPGRAGVRPDRARWFSYETLRVFRSLAAGMTAATSSESGQQAVLHSRRGRLDRVVDCTNDGCCRRSTVGVRAIALDSLNDEVYCADVGVMTSR